MPRVLFDSIHNEYLRISKWGAPYFDADPERMDWQRLAFWIERMGYSVYSLEAGRITADLSDKCDIFVLADPEQRYFHTWQVDEANKQNISQLSEEEINNLLSFVENGGGLFVIEEKYCNSRRGNNLNDLVKHFGVKFKDNLVESETCYENERTWPVVSDFLQHPITKDIDKIVMFEGCTLEILDANKAKACGYTSKSSHPKEEPMLAVADYGKGHAVMLCDATMFSQQGLNENFMYYESHKKLLWNIIRWLTPPQSLSQQSAVVDSSNLFPSIILHEVYEGNESTKKATADEQKLLQGLKQDIEKSSKKLTDLDDIKSKLNDTDNKFTALEQKLSELQESTKDKKNRLHRFLDLVSDVILMFFSLALTQLLTKQIESTPVVIQIIFCVIAIIAAVFVKLFFTD